MPSTLTSQPAIDVVPAISAGALVALGPENRPIVIDLRSSAEFADDHVPGAHSVPLFDDGDRALVGFLYVRRSPEEAFHEGRAIVLAKIDALLREIGDIAGWAPAWSEAVERVRAWTAGGIARLERELTVAPIEELPRGAVVLACWRGGLRSRSVAALLRSLGRREVVILEGGYRAWRREVLAGLERLSAPPAFVLRGLTGVGKTLVLRAIERRRPLATIDLEEAAGHRSSLLGMVGLQPCSQRTFETRLFERMRRGFRDAVVLEGESRKVGDSIVPRALWELLAGGTNIELRASVEGRVDVLLDDYLADPAWRGQVRAQLALIEGRMSRYVPLVELLDRGRERELVELLLEHYYDPLYRHSERGRACAWSVDASDPERAATEIVARIETLVPVRRAE